MNSTKSTLLAEFQTSTHYLDRLLFAFIDMEKIHVTPSGKKQTDKLLSSYQNFFTNNFLDFELSFTDCDLTIKETIKNFHEIFEGLIKIPLSSTKKESIIIRYINHTYKEASDLHQFLNSSASVEIPFPRVYLAKEVSQGRDENTLPLFKIDQDDFQIFNDEYANKESTLAFLDIKRNEKYDHFLYQGHLKISAKNYEEAKNLFQKAKNYRDTAEVLTLIAWCHSLLGDNKEAKSYCLKAIQLDSQYGPAYNDYGNYILSEGKLNESIRWFEHAKRARNYQSREYPYINAGRAYVLMKRYDLALEEFSLALTIAPHHEELHETVAKLKQSLEKPVNQSPNLFTVV